MANPIAKWEEVRRKVAELGRAHVRAGVVGQEAHRQHAGSNLTIGQLAILHELGNPSTNLPARSFVRSTLENATVAAEFAVLETKLVGQVIAGVLDRDTALRQLGTWISDKIRQRILAGEIRPSLAPATVARKGGESRPLVESFELVEAIGYEIEK